MGSSKPATSDGGRILQSGQTVADIHLFGLLLVAFVGSYLGKIVLSKLEQKNFRRIVLVLVFLMDGLRL
jgi:uncharacterized membrane protein YfcA